MDGHELEGTNIEEPPYLTGYGTKNIHGLKSWLKSPVSGRFPGGSNPERF